MSQISIYSVFKATAIALVGLTFSGNTLAQQTDLKGVVSIDDSAPERSSILATKANDPNALILEIDNKRSAIVETRPIKTLNLHNGAKLTFLDLGDGYVGVSEQTTATVPFVTKKMESRWQATPLEIYLAFAPQGYEVPQIMVTDHNLRRARNHHDQRQPRDLASDPAVLHSLDDPGLEEYACDSFGGEWVSDWQAAFDGITDHHPAAYLHQNPNAYYFYPGYFVYQGIGSNQKTYLGACNGDSVDNLVLEIFRWGVTGVDYNPSPSPPTVNWGWIEMQEVSLDSYTKYTFYSGHPFGRYRGRAEGEGGSTVEHYGVAAAWSKSLHM